jgi:hypothetical protein
VGLGGGGGRLGIHIPRQLSPHPRASGWQARPSEQPGRDLPQGGYSGSEAAWPLGRAQAYLWWLAGLRESLGSGTDLELQGAFAGERLEAKDGGVVFTFALKNLSVKIFHEC